MTLGENVQVFVRNAAGDPVDITDYVRYRRTDLGAYAGRSTELDQIGAGRMQLGLDNSSGIFTPGRSGASLQLTLGMPISVTETLGYRTFQLFSGFLELPDVTEDLEGVDNLIAVNAVDRKQLLDNGRTFISTLGAHIVGSPTLRCYYPLNETAGPWRDVVGKGAPFYLNLSRSSAVTVNTGMPAYTAGGGTQIAGDDIQGVRFDPTFADLGAGFNQVVEGWQIIADFQLGVAAADRPQFTSSEAITFIVWVAINGTPDHMDIMNFDLWDLALTEAATTLVYRVMDHATMGANAGLLYGQVQDVFAAGTLDGDVKSTNKWVPAREVMVPVGIQITFGQAKLWLADQEYTAALTGSPSSPQQVFGNVNLGQLAGSLAHFQIHTGAPSAFTHADFLEQYRVGLSGMAGDRTDERIARILRYVSPTTAVPAQLDAGCTYMQIASLAGKKPGQAIDDAVDTERGRFFVAGDGVSRFHSRVRTHYNL